MKIFITIIFLVFLTCSCTNENSKDTASQTTDTSTTTSPEVTNPTPKVNSKYAALTPSVFTGRIAEHQGKAFLDLVEPKQRNLKATTNDFVVRRDTLYEVQYLPFKDQELYLHTIAIEQTKEKEILTNWCFSVLKNGTIIREDQLISADHFLRLGLEKMKVGDSELVFVGTKKDGTTETFKIPYDGKKT
jgi:hypothetical protein